MSTQRYGVISALVVALALSGGLGAQTKIVPPKNGYKPAEDVKLGQEAAAEAKKQLPMLNDDRTDDWVEEIGSNLVRAIPQEFQFREFRYSFEVINQREINAFALPGGPMFLNRGMIEAAKSEGEVAGVMAHEISHVALRHGTANASKGQKAQIGSIAGQILGAIVGGGLGTVISQGSQIGAGLWFMKYGREYERQADLLGAQILARAGYNPIEMANMFKTIEAEGKGGGPEWMSSHPNPGNRYNAIVNESKSLRVQGNASTGEFAQIRSRLSGMSPAYTAEQVAKGQARTGGTRPVGTGGRTVNVQPPSTRYRTHEPGNFMRVAVPENWEPVQDQSGVTYAPDGGFFQGDNGGTAFTHGIQFGVTRAASGNLQNDTEQLLQGFARSNPDLRRQGDYTRENIGGRNGLTTALTNTSEVTGEREVISLSTVYLDGGDMLFIIGVAPQSQAGTYSNHWRQIRRSVQLR